MINNDVKIDIIIQHQGENLAKIQLLQDAIEQEYNKELINDYNNRINDFLAQNIALESLKQTLI